jgi:hypothetical protein
MAAKSRRILLRRNNKQILRTGEKILQVTTTWNTESYKSG